MIGTNSKKKIKEEDQSIDIINLNNKILSFFEDEKKNIQNYKDKIEDLKKLKDVKNLSKKTLDSISSTIDTLKMKINNIENETDYEFYISQTIPIIKEFQDIIDKPLVINFMGKKPKTNKRKQTLIDNFIKIAKNYCDDNSILTINNNKNTNNVIRDNKTPKMICSNCKNKKDFEVEDANIYSCVICGCEQEDITFTSSYKDIDRVNISSKYKYDRTIHFRDAINQYQGKQNCSIDDKIFKDLEEEFDCHHLLIGKKGELDDKERFKNITKNHVYEFLKELGRSKHTTSEKQFYTKHYENVNLIHYKLTGIKPDDIGYLEDELMNDFSKLIELYDKIYKDKERTERKNFLNTQHILYQLLKNREHKCKQDDFNILKTNDRKCFHDDICERLFNELGWNYQPLI